MEMTSLLDKAESIQVRFFVSSKALQHVLIGDAISCKENSGGPFHCLYVFSSGLQCEKVWPTRYELQRHLKTHLGCGQPIFKRFGTELE